MHVYPTEFVSLIIEKWSHSLLVNKQYQGDPIGYLPEISALEDMISTCYQASMMREESRPVSLRLILIDPSFFPPGQGPPSGFHRLLFSTPRPFNEYELCRLFPAVSFERSLIGVSWDQDQGFHIWGIIHSGIRWLQNERGGSKQSNLLPDAFVTLVNGPGMLTVCKGNKILAVLSSGKIVESSSNVFKSDWMRNMFAATRRKLIQDHEAFRNHAPMPVARISDEFIENLQFQLLKRIISITRMSNHGGSFLIFPVDQPAELAGETPKILLKYRFQEEENVDRQQTLFLKTIQVATMALGDEEKPDKVISWLEYVQLRDSSTNDLQEALYEHAQFLASLSAVDGAVVIGKRNAIGFGGMIVGSFDKLAEVARAHDPEGQVVTLENIEGRGSRHRSVYHLCNEIPQVMAIVVSQDGSVQLAKWLNGIVTYWDLTTTNIIEE